MHLSAKTSPTVFAQTILGVTPHPTQVEWLECRAKVKTACCGRRWGKSFAEAIDLIWFACSRPKTTQFLFAPTADQSRIIMEYVQTLLVNSAAIRYARLTKDGRPLQSNPFPYIGFVNGSSIHARTAGASGVPARGRGADRIVLDEEAYIPAAIISGVIGPFLANSQYAERVNISTPFGLNHFHDQFALGLTDNPNFASFTFPSSSSPYVTAEYLAQQRLEMTALEYSIEYEANFAENQNAVFPWTLIQSAIDPSIATTVRPGRQYAVGFDPAKYSDRSGVCVLDYTELVWQAVEIRDISGRDYLVQAGLISEMAAQYNAANVLLDATSHDQMLEELKRDRVKASGFKFTNESKNELINGLVIALEQGQVKIPNNAALIDEMKYYRYELTAAGNVRLGADAKHHDDLVTALALAVQQAKNSRRGVTGNRVAVSGPRPILTTYVPR